MEPKIKTSGSGIASQRTSPNSLRPFEPDTVNCELRTRGHAIKVRPQQVAVLLQPIER